MTLTTSENLTAILLRQNELRVQSHPKPSRPDADEVQVSMRSVGICGSDVHFWTHGRIGSYIVEAPLVLGHEGSGVVTAVGANVKTLNIGDRVALEPGIPCAKCSQCRTGRYNLCRSIRFAATPPVHGYLTRVINHPASFCYKLPENVSFDAAALLEPLSVALHACARGGVSLGCSVFISGAGPIGLMCVLAARASGAVRVTVSDIEPRRLEKARDIGAGTMLIGSSADLGDTVDADIAIEASGAEAAVAMCIRQAKSGGVVVLVGMGKSNVNVPLLDACFREIDIRGVFRYCNTYQHALDLVANRVIDPMFMVTHRFTLENALQAFETARDNRTTDAIKVIIDCGDDDDE